MDALDLVREPFVFTQRWLQTPDEFACECERRGLRLVTGLPGRDQLEALHRAGILSPLFRVDKLPAARFFARQEHETVADTINHITSYPLIEHQKQGTLCDAATEEYTPWKHYRRKFRDGLLRWTSEFLYSPYQLLLVPSLQEMRPWFRCTRTTEPQEWRWRIALPAHVKTQIAAEMDFIKDLVVPLSLLEARYYPRIPNTISFTIHGAPWLHTGAESLVQTYEAYCEQFDPQGALAQLSWSPNLCVDLAQHLLSMASRIDPLDDWQDLVRLCHREHLTKLKGAALVAYDLRVAAEILLRCYEDVTQPLSGDPWSPNGIPHERLKTDGSETDLVLTEYALSPHPSLVIAVEGETEEVLLPRVLQYVGLNPAGPEVRVFVYRGCDANDQLLVQYVTAPAVGTPVQTTDGRAVLPFVRPPTRLLRLTDPEGKRMRSAANRNEWHRGMLDQIVNTLPEQYRTAEVRAQLEEQVQVECWHDTYPFEFAHFTPEEIAAVLGVAADKVRPFRDREGHNLDLDGLWNGIRRRGGALPDGRITSKVVLAQALWPVLERKMQQAMASASIENVPILRIALRVREIVGRAHRRQVALLSSPAEAAGDNSVNA